MERKKSEWAKIIRMRCTYHKLMIQIPIRNRRSKSCPTSHKCGTKKNCSNSSLDRSISEKFVHSSETSNQNITSECVERNSDSYSEIFLASFYYELFDSNSNETYTNKTYDGDLCICDPGEISSTTSFYCKSLSLMCTTSLRSTISTTSTKSEPLQTLRTLNDSMSPLTPTDENNSPKAYSTSG
ncbi:unnamed protein product [Moneuplotes crassus]|uniref:Uncharacterized protein n=1 Tax=Euplotes crassus TaxID=5936 RepID=A0AAD1UT76_EUPCR|nr:unnamed protein product [Moneuplotes crassus]